jgi:magnesium transporter
VWVVRKKKGNSAANKVGLPPGTLLYVGEMRAEKVQITVYEYDEQQCHEREMKLSAIGDCCSGLDKKTVTWIHVAGLHSIGAIETIGNAFQLHPLVLEDILNTDQRPKVDNYGDYTYLVVKMLYSSETGDYTQEQISIVLGENYVISFQESDKQVFAPVRERIKRGKGRIRSMGADYLAYALLDTIVDHYFVLLEELGEQIELLEDRLVVEPDREILTEIYSLKTNMLFMRKAVWPLREIVNSLDRGDGKFFRAGTLLYMRDVYDHIVQVIDTVETYRDMVAGMLDIYLSSVSHKLNEVMKVLTIISTIFIPLTFLAGVYGMNFKYMPELEWAWGYPVTWLVMIVSAGLMVRYFRIKKWM